MSVKHRIFINLRRKKKRLIPKVKKVKRRNPTYKSTLPTARKKRLLRRRSRRKLMKFRRKAGVLNRSQQRRAKLRAKRRAKLRAKYRNKWAFKARSRRRKKKFLCNSSKYVQSLWANRVLKQRVRLKRIKKFSLYRVQRNKEILKYRSGGYRHQKEIRRLKKKVRGNKKSLNKTRAATARLLALKGGINSTSRKDRLKILRIRAASRRKALWRLGVIISNRRLRSRMKRWYGTPRKLIKVPSMNVSLKSSHDCGKRTKIHVRGILVKIGRPAKKPQSGREMSAGSYLGKRLLNTPGMRAEFAARYLAAQLAIHGQSAHKYPARRGQITYEFQTPTEGEPLILNHAKTTVPGEIRGTLYEAEYTKNAVASLKSRLEEKVVDALKSTHELEAIKRPDGSRIGQKRLYRTKAALRAENIETVPSLMERPVKEIRLGARKDPLENGIRTARLKRMLDLEKADRVCNNIKVKKVEIIPFARETTLRSGETAPAVKHAKNGVEPRVGKKMPQKERASYLRTKNTEAVSFATEHAAGEVIPQSGENASAVKHAKNGVEPHIGKKMSREEKAAFRAKNTEVVSSTTGYSSGEATSQAGENAFVVKHAKNGVEPGVGKKMSRGAKAAYQAKNVKTASPAEKYEGEIKVIQKTKIHEK